MSINQTPGERRVFRLIRQRPGISRVELAGAAALSTGTVTQIVKRLRDRGLADEGAVSEARAVGRNRVGLRACLEPDRMVGISVRPDLIRYVVVDWSGAVREERTIAAQHLVDQGPVIDRLGQALADQRGTLRGVGLGIPEFPAVIRDQSAGWAENFRRALEVPVTVLNNGAAAAVAEEWRWVEEPPERFLLVYFGSGIGGALVHHRRFGRPPSVHPVEIGHVGISLQGIRCICGNVGCVETVAGPARLARQWEGLESARERAALVESAEEALIYALSSVINVLQVEQIVLGGLNVPVLERFYGTLIRRLGSLRTPRGAPVKPRLSQIGDYSAAIGAALAAIDGVPDLEVV